MKSVRTTSILALLGSVAILMGGWFVLVSPKRGEVSDVKDSVVSQQAANRVTKGRIELLTKQSKDLPKKQAELARLAQQLPSNPALPGLVRQLTSAADEAGVQLVSLLPAPPQEQNASTTSAATTRTSTTKAGTKAPTSTRTTTRSAASNEALYGIPVQVQVRGGYFQIENFLSALEKLPRSLIVGQIVMAPEGKVDDAKGVRDGDLQASIAARVFMLGPRTAPVTTTKSSSAAAAK